MAATISVHLDDRPRKATAPRMESALSNIRHYQSLGLKNTGASLEEVKRAYKKLALKLHPDRCKEELAEEAFKRLEEAHRTLTTPTLRRTYNEDMAWWM